MADYRGTDMSEAYESTKTLEIISLVKNHLEISTVPEGLYKAIHDVIVSITGDMY